MARRRTSRFRTQATQEASLRYAPQQQTLADLLSSLGTQRDAAVQGSLAAAAGIGNAAVQGRQSALQDYGGAAYKELGSQNFTRDQLAKLASSPAVDVVKAGAESEAQAGRQRLSTMALGALDELRARGSRASEAADYAIQRALQQYGGDAGKVMQQLQAVSGQEGAFAAQRESQLAEDQAKRDVTLRGQTLTHKDRVASTQSSADQRSADRALRAAGLGETQRHHLAQEAGTSGGKVKPLTSGQNSTQVDLITTARDVVAHARQAGVPLGQVKRAFATGTPTVTATDKKTGAKTTHQGIPKIPAILAQAGFELATQRRIGAGTARRLKARGISLSGLPVMSAAETRRFRQHPPRPTRALPSTTTVRASAQVK